MSGTVGSIGAVAPAADAQVGTGLWRYVGDQAAVNLKAAFPGLQSVTVTVVAGTCQVGGDQGGAILPAGTTHSWSVTDTDDSSLNTFNFDPQPGGDVIVNWTYKGSAAG